MEKLNPYIDIRVRDAIKYIADNIEFSVWDMKEIQGDINTLFSSDMSIINSRAQDDYEKACQAWEYEKSGDHENAIKKWGEIFGNEFPQYD